MNQLVLMLYYTVFYEMTRRPYILEFYIIDILFLSFSHPSIYPHLYFFHFVLQLLIKVYAKKKFQLLQRYD